jgi:hypothetical protein
MITEQTRAASALSGAGWILTRWLATGGQQPELSNWLMQRVTPRVLIVLLPGVRLSGVHPLRQSRFHRFRRWRFTV